MSGLRTAALVAAFAFAVAPLAAREPDTGGLDGARAWTEVAWPFPLDQWGAGRAYLCHAIACGSETNLYVRAKIGFCNCTTGVSDDGELDRVGDVDLLSPRFVPLHAGNPIRVGWMTGRIRLYDVDPEYGQKQNVLAVAFNQQCDVIVATVVAGRELSPAAAAAALAFLNGDQMLRWARAELGG